MKLEMLDNYKGQDLKNFNKIKNDPRLHNIPEVSLRVMYNRGLKTVEDMEKHLFGNLQNLHDSFLLPDCDKFCEVVSNGFHYQVLHQQFIGMRIIDLWKAMELQLVELWI